VPPEAQDFFFFEKKKQKTFTSAEGKTDALDP
jgi:hypothetical protein